MYIIAVGSYFQGGKQNERELLKEFATDRIRNHALARQMMTTILEYRHALLRLASWPSQQPIESASASYLLSIGFLLGRCCALSLWGVRRWLDRGQVEPQRAVHCRLIMRGQVKSQRAVDCTALAQHVGRTATLKHN